MNYNCLRSIYKEQWDHTAEQGQDNACQNRVDASNEGCRTNSLADTVSFTGTGILSGIGCHCASQCIKGAAEEHTYLLTGSNRGNRNGTERVDGGLDHHRTDGGDGVLKSHRNTHHAETIEVLGTDSCFLPMHF